MKGLIAIVALFLTVGLAACEQEGLSKSVAVDDALQVQPNEGSAEKAGENTDETVKKAQKDEKPM